MPRSKDEHQVGMRSEQARPRLKESGFLAFERAARDEETQAGCTGLEQTGGFGFIGGADIELEVSGDRNALGAAADGGEAVGIGLTLRQDGREMGENGSPEAPQHLIARPGAVGDAGVDDGNGNAATKAAIKKVGPEFGFGEDENLRPKCVEIISHSPW